MGAWIFRNRLGMVLCCNYSFSIITSMIKGSLVLAMLILLLISGCQVGETPQTIPEFSMRLADSTKVFYSNDIPMGKTIVLIQFDPACRDCQIETEEILANISSFKNTNFYLITRHPYDEMMVFHDHLKLNTYSNIKIGIDTASVIPKQFKIRSTPLTLIFDENKILRAIFSGKADLKDLTKSING
ncbi:redoxin domain-containing protein [Chitinophaga sp. SYP-B3965]|uniref:TlpA family protein disulfide reductase n=1 Tax=Chitinophaga sp. SYP-B3965 TaxID=2663120 RepID=UPI0012998A68|nr:redoxin domain-containing protein [Chitinophaga sp. SYP-B3965]MRG44851.1 redoxin domain-containing protein [Chitinophaga sp. SYP-B3965]